MVTVIKFSDLGQSFGSRALGEKIRSQIINEINSGNKVHFDLSGVDVVSNSFADECFAKLLLNFSLDLVKKHTHFENVNDFNKMVITKSFNQRLKPVSV